MIKGKEHLMMGSHLEGKANEKMQEVESNLDQMARHV